MFEGCYGLEQIDPQRSLGKDPMNTSSSAVVVVFSSSNLLVTYNLAELRQLIQHITYRYLSLLRGRRSTVASASSHSAQLICTWRFDLIVQIDHAKYVKGPNRSMYVCRSGSSRKFPRLYGPPGDRYPGIGQQGSYVRPLYIRQSYHTGTTSIIYYKI